MKKKYSKGQMILFISILGSLDTAFSYYFLKEGFLVFTIFFWLVLFLVALCAKDSN
jgi:hypothetical protein